MKKTLLFSLAALALAFSANADRYWIHGQIFGDSGWSSTELKLNEATGNYETVGSLVKGDFGVKVTDDGGEKQLFWYSAPNTPSTAKNVSTAGTYKIQSSNNTNFTSTLEGNYTISLDWNSKELTFATYEGPVDESVTYMLRGEIFGAGDWTNEEMTEKDGIWTWTGKITKGQFGIRKMVGNTQKDWLSAPKGGGKITEVGTYDVVAESDTSTDKENWSSTLSGDDITFSFNPETMKLTLEGSATPVIPDNYPVMYLVGAPSNWETNAAYKMATDDGVTYTLTCDIEAGAEFKFYGGKWGEREFTIDNQELGDGTYDMVKGSANMALKNGGNVTFTLVQSDNFATAKLTIAGAGEVEPDQFTTVYFLSDRYNFSKNPAFKMETTDGITYKLNIPDAGSDIAFKFLAETTPAKYFSNGVQNIQNGTYTIEGDVPTNMTFHTGGNVDITLENIDNFSSIKVTIEGQDPDADPYPPIYLVGEMNDWEAEEAYRLSTEDGVNYTITVPNMSGDANFKFMGGDAHNYYFSCGRQNMADGTYDLNTNSSTGDMSLAQGGNVTFTFVLGEMHKTATLTVEGQGEPVEDEYPAMYLTSQRYNWGARESLKMSTEDGITYTLTVPDMSTSAFKFFGGDWGVRELTGAGDDLENGEYNLAPGADNMSLAIGGNVTFTLVQSNDFATAKLTIEGQEGEVVRNVSYALRGEFNVAGSWNDIQMTAVEDEDGIYTATFTPKYSGGQFGIKMLVNGEQREWYNEDVTFSAENPSATLTEEAATAEGVNCTFDFPANKTYTATFDTNTLVLTFSTSETPIEPTGNVFNIHGDIFGSTTWTDKEMTLTDGKYVLEATVNSGNFGVREIDPTSTAEDNQVNWYAATGDGEVVLDEAMPVTTEDGAKNFHIYGGNYTFTFDPTALTLTVTGTQTDFPSEGFEGWTITFVHLDGNWTPDASAAVEVGENGTAELSSEEISADTEFKFVLTKGTAGTEWLGITEAVELDKALTLGDTQMANITIPDASTEYRYTFNFDFNANPYTVTITRSMATGIESISADYSDAIFFNLQGIRVENPESGLYIMVRNGKTQKVLVK